MERPTFHESWHRVAGISPRPRAAVRVVRQHFRGRRWHVLEDPASGLFYRMNDAAYDFVARLDGRASVARAWRASVERLGDQSLTQGEAIALLGQLWQANLLWADVPADTKAMFLRQSQRRARELRGYLSSLLFLRIRLIDPDAFLNRWAPLVSWLVGPIGAILWIALLAVGAWHLAGNSGSLVSSTSSVLSGDNLLPLYITYAVIKALHEIGHALACKVFGLREGRGGEVHAIGVMMLLFLPVPYVDATSSWGLRSRFQRIMVSAAGIIVETACAAVAAIVWARTSEGTLAHAIAYNAIFLASVSTLLFNGNPLLRYDGYYVLSDLIGVPNLAGRSQEYLRWMVKTFAWGVRAAQNPAQDPGEAAWLGFYGIASAAYRVLVYAGMALFIASQQFLLGGVILLFGLFTWILVPLGQFVHYLARSPELARTRRRAVLSTLIFGAALLLPAALVPVADHARVEGVAEPKEFQVVFARADGFIQSALASGTQVLPSQQSHLIVQANEELARRRDVLDAELERLRVARALAFRDDPAKAMQIDRQIAAATEQSAWIDQQIASLNIDADIPGHWISPDAQRMIGHFARRGERLGLVADLSEMRVRAVLDQHSAALVIQDARAHVELRPRQRPGQRIAATLIQVLPGGQSTLPTASLGVTSGGATPTRAEDDQGLRTAQDFFEAWLSLPSDHGLLPGQRVAVRFTLTPRPLLSQAYRALRQVLQQRFNI